MLTGINRIKMKFIIFFIPMKTLPFKNFPAITIPQNSFSRHIIPISNLVLCNKITSSIVNKTDRIIAIIRQDFLTRTGEQHSF